MCCLVAPSLSLSGAATSRRLQSAGCTRPAHISDLVFWSRATTPETTCLPTCSNMRLEVKISPIHESPPRQGRPNQPCVKLGVVGVDKPRERGREASLGRGWPALARPCTDAPIQRNPIKVHHRMSTHHSSLMLSTSSVGDCIALVSAQTGF